MTFLFVEQAPIELDPSTSPKFQAFREVIHDRYDEEIGERKLTSISHNVIIFGKFNQAPVTSYRPSRLEFEFD